MPYTSEELLYLMEPNRSTVKGSSIGGDENDEANINTLVSVQGNLDSVNGAPNPNRHLLDQKSIDT